MFLDNGYIDFAKITPETLKTGFDESIEHARAIIDALRANIAAPNFTNTVLPIERSLTALEMYFSMATNFERAHGDSYAPVLQHIEDGFEAFRESIWQDPALHARVQIVAAQPFRRTTEAQKLVTDTLSGFARLGVHLSDAQKKELRAIKQRITVLQADFANNMRAYIRENFLYVDADTDVTGIPQTQIDTATLNAANKSILGKLAFHMVGNVVNDIMQFAQNRDLRQKVYVASASYPASHPNWDVTAQIASLRLQMANLLGYPDYASYKLDDNRMAKTPQNVLAMTTSLREASKQTAKDDIAKFSKIAAKDGIDELAAWDVAYYRRIAVETELNIDIEDIRKYFTLENVIAGGFAHAQKMLGYTVVARPDLTGFTPDTSTYEVHNQNGEQIAWLVMDLYRRAGTKKDGGWVASLTRRNIDAQGNKQIPVCSLSTNYDKPADGQPVLLRPSEAETSFHELGHIWDYISGTAAYASQAPASGPWDTVEIPSMFTENFWRAPDFINGYLRHYQTGESVPADMVQKLDTLDSIYAANSFLRQLKFTDFDVAVHSIRTPIDGAQMKQIQDAAFAPYKVMSTDVMDIACSFNHIFKGKYDTGYYSYWWAALRAYSLYETFEQNGLYDEKLSALFKKTILGKTPFLNMDESYTRITGKPSVDNAALLRRFGITGG